MITAISCPIHAEVSSDLVTKNWWFCRFTATTWKDSQDKHICLPHCHIILLPSIIQRVWNTWKFKLLEKANNIDSILCQLPWKMFLTFFLPVWETKPIPYYYENDMAVLLTQFLHADGFVFCCSSATLSIQSSPGKPHLHDVSMLFFEAFWGFRKPKGEKNPHRKVPDKLTNLLILPWILIL